MTREELKTLGRRCVTRYMQAEALRFEALRLLAEFERRQGWKTTPFPSTAEWFAGQVGITVGAAREQVRTALALEELPETSAAMQDGRLSYSKARALTRVSTPETEGALLELASRESAAELERTVRRMRVADLPAEERRYQSRRLRVWVDSEGMVEVRGRLDPETGQRLLRALEWAEDQVFRAADDPTGTRPEQRKADALGVVAGRALDGDRTRGSGTGTGAGRARPLVMLHVDEAVLKEEAPVAESGESHTRAVRSELEDGTRVSAETSRRLSCDAAVVRVGHGADGRVTGAGACTRTIPASVRRAVEARDRGCRFPGCGSRFVDVHHVVHWARGGTHTLDNLVTLCARHHRWVHEGGARVSVDRAGQVVFNAPSGKSWGNGLSRPGRGVQRGGVGSGRGPVASRG